MISQKFPNRSVQVAVLALIVFVCKVFVSESASNGLLSPANTNCACSGDVLTYNCTVVGNGSTLWEGSALDCTIVLRHNLFGQSGGVPRHCNNGDVTGRSLRVEDDCYTSQLSVTVSHTLNNKTIFCRLLSEDGLVSIGNSTLKVIQAPLPPPQNVELEDVMEGKLSFIWNAVGPNCKMINYYPTFNCGICSTMNTTSTKINCSYFQLSTDVRVCNFTVHGVRCGNQAETLATSIMVTLKLPDTPNVEVTPVYSNDGKLMELFVEFNDIPVSYVISNGISGDVTHYKICILSSSEIIYNSTITTSSCMGGMCKVSLGIEEYLCPVTTTAINVAFSAGNILGLGPASNSIRIDCSNQLVAIRYDSTSSTISCRFFDQSTGAKSCHIQYGLCTKERGEFTGAKNVTSSNMTLSLKLNITDKTLEYCYRVTASNSTHTTIIEGKIDFNSNTTNGAGELSLDVIVSVVVAILLICILVTLLIILALICYSKRQKHVPDNVVLMIQRPVDISANTNEDATTQHLKVLETSVDKVQTGSCMETSVDVTQKSKSIDDISQLNLKQIDQVNERFFVKFTIDEECDLESFINGLIGITFKRGGAFYEFCNTENVSNEKELIFMSAKEKKEYFFPDVSSDILHERGLLGEGITLPKWIRGYKVFVQSTGLGARYLPKGSTLLFEQIASLQLISIPRDQFELRKVAQIKVTDYNHVFFELHDCTVSKHSDIIDVILLEKRTNAMYTGKFAFDMVKQQFDDLSTTESALWRVFIFSECKVKSQIRKNSEALIQIKSPTELLQHVQPEKSPFIQIDQRQFTIMTINKPCRLMQFRCLHDLEEDHQIYLKVSDEKSLRDPPILNVIVTDKETNQFYTCRSWDASGIDLKQSSIVLYNNIDDNGFKLSEGAHILFREGRKLQLSKKMIPLYTNHFCECKYSDLEESQRTQSNIFVKLDSYPKEIEVLDAILKDKEIGRLFSGPCARQMVERHLLGIQQINQTKWDVFVLSKVSFKIMDDCQILCQDPNFTRDDYHILTVENDVIRMSEFIKTELDLEIFVNGRAFYEFTKKEDLLGYKEVVHVPSKFIGQRVENLCELESDTTRFYNILGTPGLSVKPPIVSQTRVFLQSTSQGARCLKKGNVILYKADVNVNAHRAAIQ